MAAMTLELNGETFKFDIEDVGIHDVRTVEDFTGVPFDALLGGAEGLDSAQTSKVLEAFYWLITAGSKGDIGQVIFPLLKFGAALQAAFGPAAPVAKGSKAGGPGKSHKPRPAPKPKPPTPNGNGSDDTSANGPEFES